MIQLRWSGLAASKILFGLLITLLPESWPKIIAVDETLERCRGKKIKAKGASRDVKDHGLRLLWLSVHHQKSQMKLQSFAA
ncbi:TPA: hypothetical protein ACVO2I_002150 [Legionella pneumophila]